MNKIALILLLALFSLSLLAQTGIYGITYGQSMEDTDKMLKEKGFTKTEKVDAKVSYTCKDIPTLKRLTIYKASDAEVVDVWYAYYDYAESETALNDAIALVEEVNGSYDFWDDYDDVFVWDIGNDKGIYVWENTDNEIVINYDVWDSYYDDEYWWWY